LRLSSRSRMPRLQRQRYVDMVEHCHGDTDLHQQANAAIAKPKGLSASRFANAEGDDAAANEEAAEGEEIDDHSSVALASVRKAPA
jgi:hypothetical protein